MAIIRLICTDTERCSFHEDGADVEEKCPGECSTAECCFEGVEEIDDELYCATCVARKRRTN